MSGERGLLVVPELTGREIGKLEQIIADTKHRSANDRQIVIAIRDKLDSSLSELRSEIHSVHREIESIRSRIYTAISVAIVLIPAIIWLLEVIGAGGI